ncbi:MAG: cytochrome c [Alphaproteobacteria bacterium]|nr:cytochrome c [Alphaproteobacteria bacterium]
MIAFHFRSALAFAALPAMAIVAPAAAQSAKRGLAIAQKNCASCHAITRTDKSRMRNALPLRQLSARYRLEQLEEAFAEGVMVTHKDQPMPAFEMTPASIADLLAYIRSISPRR